MDKFIQIVEENDFQPEAIEMVEAQPWPMVQFSYASRNSLRTADDYCFHLPYLIACAAHRIKPARWQDPDVKEDPRIQSFMQRVKFDIIIDEKDFGKAILEDLNSMQQRIKVVARGKSYSETASHPRGGWHTPKLRNTDEELIKKFTDNVVRVLPPDKIERAIKSILKLENLNDTVQFMKLISP